MPNCNTSNLGVFIPSTENPWNKKRAQHAYRRLGYGASLSEINQALSQTPSNFISDLINQTINLGAIDPPPWANMEYPDYNDPDNEIPLQHQELYLGFDSDTQNNGLRAKFTLFWHNHFVTRLEDYWCPSWLFNYYQILQNYAFGNFKDFVREIGISPAMLIFLGGFENTAAEPNENYARELYELFTLGVNNGYTQQDIVNTARALTGYTGYTAYCAPLTFNNNDYDNDNKTIFGQTGNWGYDDVINILFQEKGSLIANYICTKLYAHFISPEINEDIVAQLATTFENNNFELAPVYLQLFKSNHFFDEKAIGTAVKSPYNHSYSFLKETSFPFEIDRMNIIWFNGQLGQGLFNPVDVAGWQGNHDWINSSTLIGRWDLINWMLWNTWDNHTELLRDFAVQLSSITETDPALITKNIVDHFIPNGLRTEDEYSVATDILKDQVPQNYYDNNLWNLSWDSAPYQVLVLFFHIIKLPDFQLN